MKTQILSRFTLILFSFLFSNLLSFGNKDDSLYCIEIDGRVSIPMSDPGKAYRIELLCHNVLVDSGLVVDDESFLLRVKKNSLYTIRIFKEGHFPLVISIDTHLKENSGDKHKFNFDADYFIALHGFQLFLDLKNTL